MKYQHFCYWKFNGIISKKKKKRIRKAYIHFQPIFYLDGFRRI